MPGTFSPPPRPSNPDMHRGTCVTHVPWCMPGSLTCGFLWSRWRGYRSGHSRRVRNLQFYVSGRRPMFYLHALSFQPQLCGPTLGFQIPRLITDINSGWAWICNHVYWLIWDIIINKRGWSVRVIDTLRNLYSKTQFGVKRHGKLSMPISPPLGVNQGGIASGLLFRKY